jgi:CubicO group peptidase (beta-lactamase class C family)
LGLGDQDSSRLQENIMNYSIRIIIVNIAMATVMASTALAGFTASKKQHQPFATPIVSDTDIFVAFDNPSDDPMAVTVSCSNATNAKVPCSQFGDWIAACDALKGEGNCTTSGCTCKLPDKDQSSQTAIGKIYSKLITANRLKHHPPEVLYPPLPIGIDRLQWIEDMMATFDGALDDLDTIDSEPRVAAPSKKARPFVYLFDNPVYDFAWQGPSFDYNVFAANIEAAMNGNAVGYAYAINLLGQSAVTGAGGEAQTAVDGDIDQAANKRMTVASISKTVTAVAVLQLLEKNGLSIDDPIAPWLPADWVLGQNINALTFQDLLTHRSGYNGWGTAGGWASLQNMVASNQANPGAGFDYENNNYALFRVIIPALWIATLENGDTFGELTEALAAFMYIGYVQQYVFEPIGVNQAMCGPYGDDAPVLFYNVNNTSQAGWQTSDYGLSCGAYGWHLSAIDLAKFMAHVRYNNSILSPANREIMDDLFLGWMDPDDWDSQGIDLVGDYGAYHAHGGDWNSGDGRQFNGCVMKFPIHVEAVLLINSSDNAPGYQCETLRQAFDDAFVY